MSIPVSGEDLRRRTAFPQPRGRRAPRGPRPARPAPANGSPLIVGTVLRRKVRGHAYARARGDMSPTARPSTAVDTTSGPAVLLAASTISSAPRGVGDGIAGIAALPARSMVLATANPTEPPLMPLATREAQRAAQPLKVASADAVQYAARVPPPSAAMRYTGRTWTGAESDGSRTLARHSLSSGPGSPTPPALRWGYCRRRRSGDSRDVVPARRRSRSLRRDSRPEPHGKSRDRPP